MNLEKYPVLEMILAENQLDFHFGQTPGAPTKGTVKWWNPEKGYGFFVAEGYPKDIFAHYSAILDAPKFGEAHHLKDGDTVEFDLIEGPKGPQAAKIKKVLA
jgi:CspA family cold shock protein